MTEFSFKGCETFFFRTLGVFNNCQTRGKAEDRAGVQTLTEVYSLHKISALWAF